MHAFDETYDIPYMSQKYYAALEEYKNKVSGAKINTINEDAVVINIPKAGLKV